MKRKPDLVKAAALAAVAAKTGGVFVFATRDANLPNVENVSAEISQYPFAEVQCASCDSKFHALAAPGMQHHCVSCGTAGCKTVKASTEPTIASDENLTFLTCAGCGTHNVFHSQVASIGKALHCTLCGTGMKTTTPAVANGDMMDALNNEPAVQDVDDMELLDLDDDVLEESTTTGEDLPTEVKEAAPLTTDPVVAPTDTTTQGPVGAPAGAPVPADPVVAPTDVTTQGPVGGPVSELSDTDEMPNNDFNGDDSVSLDMLDTIDEDAALAFVYTGDKVSVVSDDKIVATLVAANAGDNASILQTEQFRSAVAHSIQTLGLRAALANYKFTAAKVTIPLNKAVAKKVESAVKVETASLGKKSDSYAEDFQQSLDIAAAGFAGNFWRNKVDPLKASMVTELSSMGLKNAQKVVDRVFAQHSVSQLREIIALARELAKKPVEARNGLAQAIDLAKYQPLVVKAADEDEGEDDAEEDDDTEEADVQAIATPVSVTASANQGGMYKSPALQSIMGNASLFNH